MTVLQKEHITQMRTRGDSYSKIASALSISENTVKSFCRRNNLTGNSHGIEKHTQSKNPVFMRVCGYAKFHFRSHKRV